MSRDAVLQYVKSGYLIEVDLLSMSGKIIVWRDREVTIRDKNKLLSALNTNELNNYCKNLVKSVEQYFQIMTLTGLLNLIQEICKIKRRIFHSIFIGMQR